MLFLPILCPYDIRYLLPRLTKVLNFFSKHGFIDNCLKEVLAERGIDYVPPGFERAPKKKTSEMTQIVTHEFAEAADGQGLGDDTIVFVALDDDSQAQVRN